MASWWNSGIVIPDPRWALGGSGVSYYCTAIIGLKFLLGKFAEDLDMARRLEAGEAENDEVMQEKVSALLENERLKEEMRTLIEAAVSDR